MTCRARFAKPGPTSSASHATAWHRIDARDKEQLPFQLLADVDEKVCKLFDVIKEKNMYGKKVMGIERSTFLIDGEGVLRQEWRKVKVPGHADEVLTAAKAL